MSDIALAIATADRPRALARCLDAALTGDVLPAQVIVVDQSSGDGAGSIVEARALHRVPMTYLRQQQRGLSASRNAAIRLAQHAIIAVTDDDCLPDPRWLATVERAFARSDRPDAVTGRVLPLGPDVPGLHPVASRTSSRSVTFTGAVTPWRVGTGANFAVKREWMERVGPYDERLGAGSPGEAGEDLDLLYRLLRAGARIRYEADAIVYHERQSTARRMASRSTYGHGAGACFGIWLRRGNLRALGILVRWLGLRLWRLADALRRRHWAALYEEWLVLLGTARGLAYGARVG